MLDIAKSATYLQIAEISSFAKYLEATYTYITTQGAFYFMMSIKV